MNTADLEKYGFSETDADIICEDDLFFIEHHENLFYMNPLELAKAINAMGEDELLQFNHKTWGAGYNAELMRKKINDLAKYVTINPAIFGEAVVRNSIFEKWEYTGLKEMYQTKTKPRHAIFEILFCRFPQFRTHYSILESNGIIRKKENGCLEWTLSKISLAQYFECLENNDQRRRWSVIEKHLKKRICVNIYTIIMKPNAQNHHRILKELKTCWAYNFHGPYCPGYAEIVMFVDP